MLGPGMVGAWVQLRLVGGHDMVCQVVDGDVGALTVRERGADETWHVQPSAVVAWRSVAVPADGQVVEVGA